MLALVGMTGTATSQRHPALPRSTVSLARLGGRSWRLNRPICLSLLAPVLVLAICKLVWSMVLMIVTCRPPFSDFDQLRCGHFGADQIRQALPCELSTCLMRLTQRLEIEAHHGELVESALLARLAGQ